MRTNLVGLCSTVLFAACATSNASHRTAQDNPPYPAPPPPDGSPLGAVTPAQHEPLPAPPPPPPEDGKEDWAAFPVVADGSGAPMANFVRKLIGLKSLRHVSARVPDDCTGLVRLAYWQVSVELLGVEGERGDNGVMAIFRHAEALGAIHFHTPEPGDLVFFRETYDRNKDGRLDDGLTHVGVVMRTEPDGTVVFAHRIGAGVSEGRLNPFEPSQHEEKGHVLNDWLRPASKHARASLTGELFSGFASAEKLVRAAAVGRR